MSPKLAISISTANRPISCFPLVFIGCLHQGLCGLYAMSGRTTSTSPCCVRCSMAAELATHGLLDHPGEDFLAARGKARVERRAQHRGRHPFVDGGLQRPAALAGIGDAVRGAGLVVD